MWPSLSLQTLILSDRLPSVTHELPHIPKSWEKLQICCGLMMKPLLADTDLIWTPYFSFISFFNSHQHINSSIWKLFVICVFDPFVYTTMRNISKTSVRSDEKNSISCWATDEYRRFPKTRFIKSLRISKFGKILSCTASCDSHKLHTHIILHPPHLRLVTPAAVVYKSR